MEKKFKKMTKKQLEGLEITQTRRGFTIWATEPSGKRRRHWLIDASCFYDDGEIRIGQIIDGDKLHAIVDTEENKINFVVSK